MQETELQNLRDQAAVTRIIGFFTFFSALDQATEFRCTEIKNENLDLEDSGFFSFLSTIRPEQSQTVFYSWWLANGQRRFQTFEFLIKKIKHIGLVRIDKEEYSFPYIFDKGLHMKS